MTQQSPCPTSKNTTWVFQRTLPHNTTHAAKQTAIAKQQAINAAKGKSHLTSTEGTAGEATCSRAGR